jgi:dTDP-4-dehydrorhamnose 3,5-epimerase
MEVLSTDIPDVKVLAPRRHSDSRGFFSETYNARALAEAGIDLHFVQDNHSLSVHAGTVRGLHFQTPPVAQDKLVRVTRGRILDVTVDLRRSSPTFGRHVVVELSAANWRQVLVPAGFAHGFVTLESDTEVLYKVTQYFSAPHDKGLLWNDPALGIDWPVNSETAILSDKDRGHPPLSALPDYF